MPWAPGQSGNPEGAGKAKPYRDALRMEEAALAAGDFVKHPKGSLRAIAQARLLAASEGYGFQDAKEVADRLDGKVAQPIGGSSDLPPLQLERIEVVSVDPANQGGEEVPPTS